MVTITSARVVLVSAIASGQGKTTTTAALARQLTRLGQRVRIFKTGPDFIDPMMLELACGTLRQPVYSLDLWMVGQAASQAMLAKAAANADVILIEGVMGLYDGKPSSADLARAFGVPVLAVLDASAMAQTVGALAMGLRDYGPVPLAGVIANRIASAGHASMVTEAMRDIALFGYLPRQTETLPERHLGLVLPQEIGHIDAILDQLADQLVLDMDAWNSLPLTHFSMPDQAPVSAALPEANAAPNLALNSELNSVPDSEDKSKTNSKTNSDKPLEGKTIAVARDAAFAFLYPANLDCLRELGATLVFFSPLANEGLPARTDGVYLPGGYPELYAQTLSEATLWQDAMRAAHAADMPILAECGGMIALTEGLTDQGGQSWSMAGLLPGRVLMQVRLAALGAQSLATAEGDLRGHTFHYSRFETSLVPQAYTVKQHASQANTPQGEAIYLQGNLQASYFHAYFSANPLATAALFLPR